MMNCDKAKELLSDYIEGTLEIGQKEQIEQFLKSDQECKKLFEQAQLIKNHFKILPTYSVSEEFDAKLRQRIVKLNKGEEKPTRFSAKGLSIAFSGVLTLAVLYIFIFPGSSAQNTGPQEVAPVSKTESFQPAEAIVDNEEISDESSAKEILPDSLKNEPQEVDNSKIKLTGDK